MNKSSDCWYTPPTILNLVLKVLEKIDLDPCADDGEHINALKHYTHKDDGLNQEWHGRVFINPPYSCPGKWMAKLREEFGAGRVVEAIALVPASTDTNWLNPLLLSQAVCFWKGRIKFLDTNYQPKNSARQSHCLLYWGNQSLKFKNIFKEYGVVYLPDLEDLSCTLTTSVYSQESEDLKKESKLQEEELPLINWLKSIQTPKESCDRVSQESRFIQISKISSQKKENLISAQLASPARGQVSLAMEADLTTENQASGLNLCVASQRDNPTLSLSKTLQDLSIEDYEQFLEDSEFADIVGMIHKSYRQRNSEDHNNEKGFLSLPTPTTYAKGSSGSRPAGATRLEQKLKKLNFIAKGDKLNPAVPGWLQGFPLGWVEEILMAGGSTIQPPITQGCDRIPQNAENLTTSTHGLSALSKQRSQLKELSTSIPSSNFPPEPIPPELIPPRTNSPRTNSPSGWLENYVKNKKLKSGAISTFPKVAGYRDKSNPKHWYWAYKYEDKSNSAKSANGFITRAISVPFSKVELVRKAIACHKSINEILILINTKD